MASSKHPDSKLKPMEQAALVETQRILVRTIEAQAEALKMLAADVSGKSGVGGGPDQLLHTGELTLAKDGSLQFEMDDGVTLTGDQLAKAAQLLEVTLNLEGAPGTGHLKQDKLLAAFARFLQTHEYARAKIFLKASCCTKGT